MDGHSRASGASLRRASATVGLTVVLLVGVLTSAAAGQEGEPTPPPESSTTTTSTTAPPVTVVLDDGDVGVVPPGATDPNAPPEGPPPGELPPPAEGELAIPEELPVVLLPDPTPGLNAALAAIDVSRAEQALADAEPGRVAAELELAAALDAAAEATARRRVAAEELTHAKGLVDELAANLVVYGDVVAVEPIALDSLDALRDRQLGQATAEELRANLEEARVVHQEAVAAEDAALVDLRQTRDQARFVRALYLQVRTRLDEAIRHAEEARRLEGPTILGPTVLAVEDLVAWYFDFYPIDPPVAPIERIVEAYVRIGDEEGVAGDIAFAQAILETGGFRSGHAQGFNFAGIGAFDHCAPVCGFRFPNLDQGVRAHIHLLRAYADPGLTTAQLAASPNRLVAPERVGVRGCCQRWTQLTGVWASDPQYDRKVLGIYRLMVEKARARQRFFATAP